MLNYIWVALIVIGILAATGRDIYDSASNTYGNEVRWSLSTAEAEAIGEAKNYNVTVYLSATQMQRDLPASRTTEDAAFPARIVMQSGSHGRIILTVDESAPEVFHTIASTQSGKNTIAGDFFLERPDNGEHWTAVFDPVGYIYLKRIVNAAFEAAGTAVQIAIGLIGIMALWLGVMNIAQEAGLIGAIARGLRPVTERLFPEIPTGHPAIASMIMNISANMLGLGNAATPFGLKAMEELNKLNPRAGTASNSMVTFLALNTSCVTLIPATAIAVRAAMGSADPSWIIGATFCASLTATIVAVTVSKILQRWKMFRLPPVAEAQ